MPKSSFSQIRIQLHRNTISKNANGTRAFIGNFLCGVERVKRFVKVHLCCIVRNLKIDKRNVDVAPPGKISADEHDCYGYTAMTNIETDKTCNYI